MNKLFFGDNLDVLREHISDEVADLIYLDPPFNSKARYNVLFQTPAKDAAAAQAEAFRDTWAWGEEAEWAAAEIARIGGGVARIVDALRSALKESDMMAYLVMMAVRLEELRRVLKDTGSIYLHCDSTASAYLKVLMDAIFGPRNFRNEITWKRRVGMSSAVHESNRFGICTDTILFYAKSPAAEFHPQYNRDDPDYIRYIDERFTYSDETGRRFQPTSLVNPAYRPNLIYDYKGYKSPPNGWMITREKMEQWDKEGRIYFPSDPNGRLRRKSYADELRGMPVQNLWTDIPELNSQAQERLGYPTQKPLALLDRIIAASSRPGDVVLDPFCGCGTTVHSAQSSKRQWIGIDIAFHAIRVIEDRLAKAFGGACRYDLSGIPRDVESAHKLAERDKYQFQWWANYLVGVHSFREIKKGADRGIDGEMFFMNGPGRPWGRILTSVKGGKNVGVAELRDLRGVLERERAEMALFICLRAPTPAMKSDAAAAGFVETAHGALPRIQIVSIEEWFDGRRPSLPSMGHIARTAFDRKPKHKAVKRPDPNAPELPLTFAGGKKDADMVRHLNPQLIERETA